MEQNQQQQQQFRGTGDCLTCRAVTDRKIQWQYCAAQKGLENQRMLMAMTQALENMTGEVRELKEKIRAIQDSEATVFDPSKEPEEADTVLQQTAGTEQAQKGAGAV